MIDACSLSYIQYVLFAVSNMNGNGQVHTNGNGCSAPALKKVKLVDAKDELAEFDKVFTVLMDDCLNEGNLDKDSEIGDAMRHFLKVCKLVVMLCICNYAFINRFHQHFIVKSVPDYRYV